MTGTRPPKLVPGAAAGPLEPARRRLDEWSDWPPGQRPATTDSGVRRRPQTPYRCVQRMRAHPGSGPWARRGAARAARLVPETRRTWDSGLVVGRRLGPENEEGPKSGATPRPDSREQGSAAARLGSVQGSKTPGWLVGPSLRSPRQPHGSSREWAARNAQLTRVALKVWLAGPNSIGGRWNVLPGQVWPPPSTR